ncbi:MAG TPA: hypothetical protein VEQ60_19850 [Longimicrobium sp.]|nr:hypothetical protein [Longimicrobium sp.]
MTGPRWLPAAAVTVFAAALAWLNRGERVAVDTGVFTFYRAPLAIVLLVVFLAGMLAMLLLGLRHDRRVRDELRRHGLLQPEEPARPAPSASAWGVVAPRENVDRTSAYDGRTSAHPREEDRTVAHFTEEERTVHPKDDERTSALLRDDSRTVAHPRDDDRTISHPRDGERTIAFPRYDEDPAA